ncbi:Ig-like domain-containing protein [Rubrivirga sp.]|uniref:Ig-like domain-containing protein n=1 Tax=Rubrivirga sp. TaxID=1885344 RepID=UPI003C74CEDD
MSARPAVLTLASLALVTGRNGSICVQGPYLSEPHTTLVVGDTTSMQAGRICILGECHLAWPTDVRWTSSDPGVIEVDAGGTVTAVSAGEADALAWSSGVFPGRRSVVVTHADSRR